MSDIDFSGVLSYPSPENVKESCMSFIKVLFTFVDKNKVLFAAVFSDRHSLSFDTTLINVITDFCALKLTQVLEGVPDYKSQLFSNFYSGSVVGVIKWYVKNYDIFFQTLANKQYCGKLYKNFYFFQHLKTGLLK